MSEFSTTITGINGGETETSLSLKLKELVAAVADTGRKGSITLKLSIERNKRNVRLLEITAEVKAVIPSQRLPRPLAAEFRLHDGELVPLEDNQLDLPGIEPQHSEVIVRHREPVVFEEVTHSTNTEMSYHSNTEAANG